MSRKTLEALALGVVIWIVGTLLISLAGNAVYFPTIAAGGFSGSAADVRNHTIPLA